MGIQSYIMPARMWSRGGTGLQSVLPNRLGAAGATAVAAALQHVTRLLHLNLWCAQSREPFLAHVLSSRAPSRLGLGGIAEAGGLIVGRLAARQSWGWTARRLWQRACDGRRA
jgi:hypothetical protein